VDLHLEPQDAFGDYDDGLLFLEPRHLFPEQLEEGMGFEGLPAGCNPAAPKDRLYFVSDIYPDHVVMDANHPLAGIALRIHLRVHAVREAQEDEIGQGTLGTSFFGMQVDTGAEGGNELDGRPTLH
jgi:FKBP-type peptidyl-prolyl cis-trans isomerase SlyD